MAAWFEPGKRAGKPYTFVRDWLPLVVVAVACFVVVAFDIHV